MELTAIAVVAVAVLAYALVSGKIDTLPVSLPIVFCGLGWVLGAGGLGVATVDPGHAGIHAIAEFTLILILFSDAARIDLMRLVDDHILPLRMLAIGLPLAVVAGTVSALLLFPDAGLATALLVAAILAPTDAALGQPVVSAPSVPVRIRQALNVESGLNDGLALPIVLIAAAMASPVAVGGSFGDLLIGAGRQVILGPIAGVAVGFAGSRLIEASVSRGLAATPFQGIALLAIAILAFAAAETVGGNGFIAAFVAGLVFGANARGHCKFLFEFMEGEGQLLTMIVFLVFGATMLPEALAHAGWATLALAILFLTVVRMVPIAVSLSGSRLSPPSILFLGWFGPRGIASILFALLILAEHHIPSGTEILACVVVTVALSVVLHGVTAAPFSRLYGAYVARKGDCAEVQPVTEMRLRHGAAPTDETGR